MSFLALPSILLHIKEEPLDWPEWTSDQNFSFHIQTTSEEGDNGFNDGCSDTISTNINLNSETKQSLLNLNQETKFLQPRVSGEASGHTRRARMSIAKQEKSPTGTTNSDGNDSSQWISNQSPTNSSIRTDVSRNLSHLYSCSICLKKFKDFRSLKRHKLLVHTNIKRNINLSDRFNHKRLNALRTKLKSSPHQSYESKQTKKANKQHQQQITIHNVSDEVVHRSSIDQRLQDCCQSMPNTGQEVCLPEMKMNCEKNEASHHHSSTSSCCEVNPEVSGIGLNLDEISQQKGYENNFKDVGDVVAETIKYLVDQVVDDCDSSKIGIFSDVKERDAEFEKIQNFVEMQLNFFDHCDENDNFTSHNADTLDSLKMDGFWDYPGIGESTTLNYLKTAKNDESNIYPKIDKVPTLILDKIEYPEMKELDCSKVLKTDNLDMDKFKLKEIDKVEGSVTDKVEGSVTDKVEGSVTDKVEGLESDILDMAENVERQGMNKVDKRVLKTQILNNIIRKKYKCKSKYFCKICGRKFAKHHCFVSHVKLHSANQAFTCDICYKTYPNEAGLERHKWSHVENKPFICSICEKSFAYQYQLQKHLFNCEMQNGCPEKRKEVGKVDMNLKGEEEKFECSGCGKRFKFEFSLHRHQKLNLKETSCPICKVQFVCRCVFLAHQQYQCRQERTSEQDQIETKDQTTSTSSLKDSERLQSPTRLKLIPSSSPAITSRDSPTHKSPTRLSSPRLKSPIKSKSPPLHSPTKMTSPNSDSGKKLKSPSSRMTTNLKSLTSKKTSWSPITSPTSLTSPPIISIKRSKSPLPRSPSSLKTPTRLKSPLLKTSTLLKSPPLKSPAKLKSPPLKSPKKLKSLSRSLPGDSQTTCSPPLTKKKRNKCTIEDYLYIQCKKCHESFTDYEQFLLHMDLHKNKQDFKCRICGKIFGSRSRLCRHRDEVHGQKRFFCPSCNGRFTRKESCTKHIVKRICFNVNNTETENILHNTSAVSENGKLVTQCKLQDTIKRSNKINTKNESDIEMCNLQNQVDITENNGKEKASKKKFKLRIKNLKRKRKNNVEILNKGHTLPNKNVMLKRAGKVKNKLHKKGLGTIKIKGVVRKKKNDYSSAHNRTHATFIDDSSDRKWHFCPKCNRGYHLKDSCSKHMKLCKVKTKAVKTSNENGKEQRAMHSKSANDSKMNCFECSICGKGFTHMGNRRRHIENVHEKRKVGDKKSDKKVKEKNPADQKEFTKRYKCPVCQKDFTHNGNLNRHVKDVHQKINICDKKNDGSNRSCTIEDETKQSDNIQLADQNESMKNHKCSLCDKEFKRSDSLIRHLKTNHAISNFKCSLCDKTFMVKGSLSRHLKMMHGVLDIFNEENNSDRSFTFEQNAYEEGHQISNNQFAGGKESLKKHKCPLCDKDFKLRGNLNRHLQNFHGSSHVTNDEQTSNRSFRIDENADEEHQISENQSAERNESTKYQKCSLCEKDFKLKRSLTRHLKMIHGMLNVNYEEETLNRSFAKEEIEEEEHQMSDIELDDQNESIKHHKCLLCEKDFKLKGSFTRHLKMIHGTPNVRDKKNGDLDRVFTIDEGTDEENEEPESNEESRSNSAACADDILSQPRTIVKTGVYDEETDERFCLLCDKMFSSKTNLKRHVKEVHEFNSRKSSSGTNWPQCSVCNKMFSNLTNLKRHEKIHAELPRKSPFNVVPRNEHYNDDDDFEEIPRKRQYPFKYVSTPSKSMKRATDTSSASAGKSPAKSLTSANKNPDKSIKSPVKSDTTPVKSVTNSSNSTRKADKTVKTPIKSCQSPASKRRNFDRSFKVLTKSVTTAVKNLESPAKSVSKTAHSVKSPTKSVRKPVKNVKGSLKPLMKPDESVKSPSKSVATSVKNVKSPAKLVMESSKSVKSPTKSGTMGVKNVTSLAKLVMESGKIVKSPTKSGTAATKIMKSPAKSLIRSVKTVESLTKVSKPVDGNSMKMLSVASLASVITNPLVISITRIDPRTTNISTETIKSIVESV